MNEKELLINKIIDKYNQSNKNKKITNTNFLNTTEIQIAKRDLQNINYLLFGGYEESERKAIFFIPKLSSKAVLAKYLSNTIKAVRIVLHKDSTTRLNHRDYLGILISIGIEREKIGDILVREDGADIITFLEIAEFICTELLKYSQFKSSQITIINTNKVLPIETKFEEKRIVLSSLRLDNFVSELANLSRKMTENLINNEKVLVNNKTEKKGTKQIKEKDILTIRGKGKYIIEKLEGRNKKNKEVVIVKHYI